MASQNGSPFCIYRTGWSYRIDFVDRFTTQSIAAIAADNVSGAVEIADKSAEVLARLARRAEPGGTSEWYQAVLATGWALINAHPTMAPLVNLVNAVLRRLDGVDASAAAQRAVLEVASDFKRRLRVHEAAIAEMALRLIPEDAQVITNGRSTTVCAALRYAQRAGRRFRVLCAEGRPACEGRSLAAELAAGGIPMSLATDALVIALVGKAQVVLVGADHLTGQGLVNKVGTYGIALAARAAGVPIYALCSSEKFLPPGYTPPAQADWPAEQVWPEALAGVNVLNYYFDATPLDLLSGVVTEQGIQTRPGIDAWLAATHLHPALSRAKD
jgi:translation initiation factor eIF-2B subunit delta